MTFLLHVRELRIFVYASTRDNAMWILCACLTLLLVHTGLHALIVYVFHLHGSWFIVLLHGYSWIPVILHTVYITWIIVTWVVHPVSPLHDYFLLLICYSRYWIMSCWYAMCGIPHLLFPFPVILLYAINRAQVLLSCYPYHVLYLFLLHCILDISDHKDNLGMGETWRLIRSYRVDVLDPYC